MGSHVRTEPEMWTHLGPAQVGDDPFSALKAEKKERVREQHKRQLSNLKASAKAAGRGAAALPPTLRLAAGLPAHGKGRLLKRAEVKEDVRAFSCPG